MRRQSKHPADEPRGRGRPKGPDTVYLNVKVTEDVWNYLDSTGNKSQSIETMVRSSSGFKSWKKQQASGGGE